MPWHDNSPAFKGRRNPGDRFVHHKQKGMTQYGNTMPPVTEPSARNRCIDFLLAHLDDTIALIQGLNQ